jgi:hypothetical protein
MSKGERLAFIWCSILLMSWLVFTFFFTNQYEMLGQFVRKNLSFLEKWRLSYNVFIDNIEKTFLLDDVEYERLRSTSFTMIYKQEYEQLREFMSISDQMDLSEFVHTGVLVNTLGTRDAEILKIVSTDTIPQKGFLISPNLSAVIGKVQYSQGNTADIIPIWNEKFTAQVMVKNQENEIEYPDVALIENKLVVNFNPAFPYDSGDVVYLSEYEPGGYTLSRYEWTRIGKIAPVKQNEIVEKYGIEYDYTREEILKERYFFIVE